MPEAPQQTGKTGKAPIDLHGADERVHLGRRRTHEVDLAHHALARADPAGLPFLLDELPLGRGKALEKKIGRIDGSDGAVEVDEHTAFHTRS